MLRGFSANLNAGMSCSLAASDSSPVRDEGETRNAVVAFLVVPINGAELMPNIFENIGKGNIPMGFLKLYSKQQLQYKNICKYIHIYMYMLIFFQ